MRLCRYSQLFAFRKGGEHISVHISVDMGSPPCISTGRRCVDLPPGTHLRGDVFPSWMGTHLCPPISTPAAALPLCVPCSSPPSLRPPLHLHEYRISGGRHGSRNGFLPTGNIIRKITWERIHGGRVGIDKLHSLGRNQDAENRDAFQGREVFRPHLDRPRCTPWWGGYTVAVSVLTWSVHKCAAVPRRARI